MRVRMEDDGGNNALMSFEEMSAEATINIPDKHFPISSSSGKQSSWGMTRHANDGTIMALYKHVTSVQFKFSCWTKQSMN